MKEDRHTPASIETAPRKIDMSYMSLMGNYDFVKGGDTNQASLYYSRLTSEFKTNNPNATAEQLDEAYESIGKHLTFNIVGAGAFGSDSADTNSAQSEKARSLFSNQVLQRRERSFNIDKREQSLRVSAEKSVEADSDIEDIAGQISADPESAVDQVERYISTVEKASREAGLSEEEIAEKVKGIRGDLQETELDARIQENPNAALAHMEENQIQSTLPKAKAEALIKQENQLQSDSDKRLDTFKTSKQMAGLSLKDIQTIERKGGDSGKAARKSAMAMQKDPFKYADTFNVAEFSTLNTNDPLTLQNRVADVERASDIMGVEVPILEKSEVSRIKGNFDNSEATQRFTELTNTAPVDIRSQISEQLGTSAQAYTVRLGEEDRHIVRDILNGANAPVKGIASADRLNMYPFDTTLNVQSNKAVDALVKTGKYTLLEAREEIYNIQDVNENFLGFGGYELPLPRGVTSDEFDKVSNTLLGDPTLLAEFGNGTPDKLRTSTGKVVRFDSDDLEWVVVGQGTYGLKDEDGKLVKTEDGILFEVDMEKALGEI